MLSNSLVEPPARRASRPPSPCAACRRPRRPGTRTRWSCSRGTRTAPAMASREDDPPSLAPADAAAADARGRSHRLHFAFDRGQLLEGRAAEEEVVVPRGPEGDPWRTQLVGVEREDLLGRREVVHAAEVLFEESEDGRAGDVVRFDAHGGRFWVRGRAQGRRAALLLSRGRARSHTERSAAPRRGPSRPAARGRRCRPCRCAPRRGSRPAS